MTKQEETTIRAFVEHMLKYTVRIIRNAEEFPHQSGLASGILIDQSGDPILLTAGHIFKKPGVWTLETSLVVADRTLHAPLRDLQFLAQIDLQDNTLQDIDLAWARIPLEELKVALNLLPKDQKHQVELPFYCGPLSEEPSRSSLYGFASWSQVEFHQDVSRLVSDASFEIGMTYRGKYYDDTLLAFELARSHRGHDYYRGTSGAPIADEEGRIVALVAGGDADKNHIYGVPLALYKSVFSIQ